MKHVSFSTLKLNVFFHDPNLILNYLCDNFLLRPGFCVERWESSSTLGTNWGSDFYVAS